MVIRRNIIREYNDIVNQPLLIDKITLTADCRNIDNPNKYVKELSNLRDYFSNNGAFKVRKKYTWVSIDIIPTYYGQVATNLEMPTNQELLHLFRKIKEICPLDFYTTQIHLTKDRITTANPIEYMKVLANINRQKKPIWYEVTIPKRIKEELTEIKYYNLNLTPIKTDNKEKDYNITKLIKLYDKKEELLTHNKKRIQLRNDFLDLDLIKNLLRIEVVLKNRTNTDNLVPIEIGGNITLKRKLTINRVIEELEKGKLLEHLENSFNAELLKVLPTSKANKSIISELDLANSMPVGTMQQTMLMLDKLNLKSQEKTIINEIKVNSDTGELTRELKEKFISW